MPKKKVWESEDEKDVMFISSMVLQWIMTFCTYQQKLKKWMKPQFQWEKCWTHFWPSMEDVNLSFFCADQLRVYPRRHWYFRWWNTFKGRQKNTVKHSIKSTFSISIQLNCNWLPGNPQLPPYIYMCVCVYTLYHWIGSLRLMANMFGKKTHPVILQSQGAGQWTLRRSDVNLAQMQKWWSSCHGHMQMLHMYLHIYNPIKYIYIYNMYIYKVYTYYIYNVYSIYI